MHTEAGFFRICRAKNLAPRDRERESRLAAAQAVNRAFATQLFCLQSWC